MPQPSPRYSWKAIGPVVESAVKSGAVSPSRSVMVGSSLRARWVGGTCDPTAIVPTTTDPVKPADPSPHLFRIQERAGPALVPEPAPLLPCATGHDKRNGHMTSLPRLAHWHLSATLESLKASSGVVSDAEAAMTSTLPDDPAGVDVRPPRARAACRVVIRPRPETGQDRVAQRDVVVELAVTVMP